MTDDLLGNPATTMRKLLEKSFPPEDRVDDWDERWAALERYCDEPDASRIATERQAKPAARAKRRM